MGSTPGISLADVAATKTAGEAIYQELCENPVDERQSRFLHYVRGHYRDGMFYASAATIADALGCARSTVQSDTREIEHRGFWEVVPHALANGHVTNVIIFWPGVLYALRKMEAEKVDRENAVRAKAANTTNKRKDTKYPQDASRLQSQHSTLLSVSEITSTSSCAESQNERAENREDVGVLETPNNEVTMDEMSAVAGVSPQCEPATSQQSKMKGIVAALIAEGVSPSQAYKLVRVVDIGRIERNLALGAHVGKRNPGGYLADAIRRDFAGTAIKPGSEAAQACEHEKSTPIVTTKGVNGGTPIPEASETPQKLTSTPVATAERLDSTSVLLDTLTESENAALRERAIAELDRQNAWLGPAWKHEGNAFEGMVRGRMVKLVRDDLDNKEYPAAPSAASAPLRDMPLFRSDHDRHELRSGGPRHITFFPGTVALSEVR